MSLHSLWPWYGPYVHEEAHSFSLVLKLPHALAVARAVEFDV